MIHVAAIIGAIIWFGLNSLLWYLKPTDNIWLLDSAILGTIFSSRFLRICNYPPPIEKIERPHRPQNRRLNRPIPLAVRLQITQNG